MSGREPTFLLGRLECTADRLRSGSLCVDLEKIRGAAERVARSEGLEIVDVEWKVGKQRFLRVYIDKVPGGREAANVPKPGAVISDTAGAIPRRDPGQRGGTPPHQGRGLWSQGSGATRNVYHPPPTISQLAF